MPPLAPDWKCYFTSSPTHKRTELETPICGSVSDALRVPRIQIQLCTDSSTPASSAHELLLLSFVMGKFCFLNKKLIQRVQVPSAAQTVFCYIPSVICPECQRPENQGRLWKFRLQLFQWN